MFSPLSPASAVPVNDDADADADTDADDAGLLIRAHVSANALSSDTAVSIDTACETHDSARRGIDEAPNDAGDNEVNDDEEVDEEVAKICGSTHRFEATLLMQPAVSDAEVSLVAANEVNTAAKAEARCVEANAEAPPFE